MKGKKEHKMNKGGKVKHHVEHEKAEHVEHHHYKKGGEVHKADGHKAKMHLAKRARGGKVATPSSPLSGAEPKGLPGGGKGENRPCDKSND